MELAVLRGEASRVRKLAEAVSAERGVRHGRLLVVAQDTHAPPAPTRDAETFETVTQDDHRQP